MTQDNYQLVVNYDKTRFLKKKPKEMAKYTNLEIIGNHIIVPHFNKTYRVNITTAEIDNAHDKTALVPTLTQMVILHHLVEVKPDARLAQEFVTIFNLKDASIHEHAFKNRAVTPLAQYFNGKADDFAAACRVLGGEAVSQGDYAFILYAFPTIPLKYIFWDGEDEMPAAANVLFDKNVTDFTHPEDTIGLGEMGAELILETARNLR